MCPWAGSDTALGRNRREKTKTDSTLQDCSIADERNQRERKKGGKKKKRRGEGNRNKKGKKKKRKIGEKKKIG